MLQSTSTDFNRKLFFAYILNSFLLIFLSFKYVTYLTNIDYLIAQIYYPITFIGHFFFLSLTPFIISIIVKKIFKRNTLSTVVYHILSGIILLIIIIDREIYTQFRFHLSPIILDMVFGKNAGDIFHFSLINTLKIIGIIAAAVFSQFIIQKAAKFINSIAPKKTIKYGFIIILLSFIGSNLTFAWADASSYRPVTQSIETLPFYFPLTCESLLTKYNLVDTSFKKKNEQLYKLNSGEKIKYPLATIQQSGVPNKKDLLFITIDSWRYDCIDSIVTPNLYQLSKQSQLFTNHHSGSNATADGIFTLFYGISGLCNKKFTEFEIAPVFFKQLQKMNYDISILSSATIENPPFNKNVFLSINPLRLNSKGKTPNERDQEITSEWLQQYEARKYSKQPLFDFLFYDSAHGFDYPDNYPEIFSPASKNIDYTEIDEDYDSTSFYNTYKNSLHFVDHEIGKIIAQLKKHNSLENTLIVITGDHGQEFNDNKKGYWQHAGNYSKHQTQTPLLIYDSTKQPSKFNHLTLHYDICATLLKEQFNVVNSYSDISIGQSLYNTTERPWFLCGYKNTYALIEKNKITKIYRNSGIFNITDASLNPLDKEEINYNAFKKAINQINQFYID